MQSIHSWITDIRAGVSGSKWQWIRIVSKKMISNFYLIINSVCLRRKLDSFLGKKRLFLEKKFWRETSSANLKRMHDFWSVWEMKEDVSDLDFDIDALSFLSTYTLFKRENQPGLVLNDVHRLEASKEKEKKKRRIAFVIENIDYLFVNRILFFTLQWFSSFHWLISEPQREVVSEQFFLFSSFDFLSRREKDTKYRSEDTRWPRSQGQGVGSKTTALIFYQRISTFTDLFSFSRLEEMFCRSNNTLALFLWTFYFVKVDERNRWQTHGYNDKKSLKEVKKSFLMNMSAQASRCSLSHELIHCLLLSFEHRQQRRMNNSSMTTTTTTMQLARKKTIFIFYLLHIDDHHDEHKCESHRVNESNLFKDIRDFNSIANENSN